MNVQCLKMIRRNEARQLKTKVRLKSGHQGNRQSSCIKKANIF